MKIAVDLRSLSSGQFTGVENYALNLLDALLALDKKNSYILFYNSLGNGKTLDLNFINSTTKLTRYPNRLLNLALMARATTLEKVIGDFDCLFMPNLNQFNIAPSARLALTVHDLSPVVTPEFYDVKRRMWHKFLNYKRAFGRANVIFAVSEYTKNDLIRIFGISPEKIKVAYPGINNNDFRPDIGISRLRQVRNIYGLPGEFILFLNTIEPRKNLAGLLSAFERTAGESSLVIMGRRGWKYKAVMQSIKNSKKSAKIKYIGYADEKDKPAIIKLAKMLVYPSFYEGFGFGPLEAMAVGTPVIVSQVTALPEVSGDAALLVNPYDTGSITTAVEALLKDENLRRRLVAKGLEKVKQYSWQKTAREVLSGLNSI